MDQKRVTNYIDPILQHAMAIGMATDCAIPNTGATSIFIMEGVDIENKCLSLKPLTINLLDGTQVQSIHECNIHIPGLPTVLTGHIVPHLAIASLIGIRPLCKAGCTVIFDDKKCDIVYNGNIILQGFKDPSTNLWMLPILKGVVGTTQQSDSVGPHSAHMVSSCRNMGDLATDPTLPPPGPCIDRAPHPSLHPVLAMFTHLVNKHANAVKFAYQLLCNPLISTLLKAMQCGFLKGCPNISKTLILKYSNPSPLTAKGYMKRPHQGIKSTCPKTPKTKPPLPQLAPLLVAPILPLFQEPRAYLGPAYGNTQGSIQIGSDDDESIANVFWFGTFANKTSSIVYHDLTGNFPFNPLMVAYVSSSS
jgi:hypothetical protein